MINEQYMAEQAQDDYFTLTDSIPQARWYWPIVDHPAARKRALAAFSARVVQRPGALAGLREPTATVVRSP